MGRRSNFTAKQKAEIVLSALTSRPASPRPVGVMASPKPPPPGGASKP
jgi:hypothetical protein